MPVLTWNQVYALARSVGCTREQAIIATAITQPESGRDTRNIGDATLAKYGSRGLFQIFTGAHPPKELGIGTGPWTKALAEKLFDPFVNARAMWIVSNHGKTWRPWSTYNNGHHRPFLRFAETAANEVGENWAAHLPGKPATHPTPTPGGPVSIAQKVITLAKAETGYHEGRSGGHWNNVEKYDDLVPGLGWVDNATTGQAWCAVFTSYIYLKAGLKPGVDFPVTASCDAAMKWYKAKKWWSEYPALGAQIFYGVPGDAQHTGIATKYDADNVWSTEGNTNASGDREGDGVYDKKHPRRIARILGYGYPKFPEGVISADPKWKKA